MRAFQNKLKFNSFFIFQQNYKLINGNSEFIGIIAAVYFIEIYFCKNLKENMLLYMFF